MDHNKGRQDAACKDRIMASGGRVPIQVPDGPDWQTRLDAPWAEYARRAWILLSR
jgi:hypothetical protein